MSMADENLPCAMCRQRLLAHTFVLVVCMALMTALLWLADHRVKAVMAGSRAACACEARYECVLREKGVP